jgi:hypothetical protein
MLNILSRRKDSELLVGFLLDYGVAGASVTNWRFTDAACEQTQGGLRINREFGSISLILAPAAIPALIEALRQKISDSHMSETCLFTHEIPIARTFASLNG